MEKNTVFFKRIVYLCAHLTFKQFKMKKTLLAILAATMLLPTPAEAGLLFWKKKKQPAKTEAPAPKKPKKEVRPAAQAGLFGVQHYKDDWYFQIPDSLLGWPFLATTRFVATPVEMGVYGGELVSDHVLYWEKQGEKLMLRELAYDASADSTQQIYRALLASTENPIVAAFKLDTVETKTLRDTIPADSVNGTPQRIDTRKIYSIKVTDFLRGDNIVTGFKSDIAKQFGLTGIRGEQSYIKSVHTYPINTEVQTVKTYGASANNDNRARSVAGRLTGVMTFSLNTSFVLLPRDPMRPRYFDPRVGYFTESHREYNDDQQQVRRRNMIARWRLEPKSAEDVEKMRRGELVEPKKPIVYYIDPATPRQWRPYLIQGVNDWNVAFEQAGWKNAIHAEEWPENADSLGMSLEDARYSVIRYLASPISNAYGPHVSDPRSGEIIETHIGWYHNVMKLVHDWYMIQAGLSDTRARGMKFDDELMGQLIRFVSSHEVGHTLGLRHNMGASSATPVDSLRNKAWVEANGHTASIMDYARFNYVAQPEDNIGLDGIFPRINTYDKWAIEWGYRYFPEVVANDSLGVEEARLAAADAERLILNKMTIEKLAQSRRYWFGGEGRDLDPRAQTEDLGDDAMRASDYGVKNLKRIIGQLPEWVNEEGDLDTNIGDLYNSLIGQMNRYVGHVSRNVVGRYLDYKSVEQPGAVFTPEEKSRSQRAMKWLDAQVLTEPKWLIAPDYVNRLTDDPHLPIHTLARTAINTLCSTDVFSRLVSFSSAKNAYKPADYVNDLVSMLFRETATGQNPDRWRCYVQTTAVTRLLSAWTASDKSSDAPYRAYITMTLLQIQQRVRSAGGDAATRAHYKDIDMRISRAFEK